MKYIIEDYAETNGSYIKEGQVTRKEFKELLINELDAYVESMNEEFVIKVNGVCFIVNK